MQNPKKSLEARIIRRFPQPVSLVYQMWTQQEHLEQWLSPADDILMKVLEFNFQVGGEFFFRYTWDDNVFPVRGKFLAIEPEKSLIFTWLPQPPDPDAGKETMISVWFRPLDDGGTEVEVRHTLFPDTPMRDRHQEGWAGAMGRLERRLALPKGSQ